MRKEGVILENGVAISFVGRQIIDIAPGDDNIALILIFQTGHNPQQC